jgi:hypothetical protein
MPILGAFSFSRALKCRAEIWLAGNLRGGVVADASVHRDAERAYFSATRLPSNGLLGNSENIERVSLTGDMRDS